MSILEHPSFAHSSTSRQDELEDAFRAWAHDPAKPDQVNLGHHRVPMAELSRRLTTSQTTLDASACAHLGMPRGVSMATAATELLHATSDPDGPRCRSFRAAVWHLSGLSHLIHDLEPPSNPDLDGHDANCSNGQPDVR